MGQEMGGSQPRREKRPLPLRNPKLCIPPFFISFSTNIQG